MSTRATCTIAAALFCGMAAVSAAAEEAVHASEGGTGGTSRTSISSPVAAACRPAEASPKEASRPNVVFIVVDDLNAEVGFLGDNRARTPNLDRLAAGATVFERAYCQAPICQPSRTSVLTGRYPHRTGIYGLRPDFWDIPALADAPTIPRHFKEHGYFSAGVGKVFHGAPHRPSFDRVSGWFGGYGPRPENPLNLDPTLGEHPLFDWGPFLTEKETADFRIAQEACLLLDEAAGKEQPFILSVGFFRPHCPLYAPQEWFDLHAIYPDEAAREPEAVPGGVPPYALTLVNYERQQNFNRWLRAGGRAGEFRRAYRASVSFADHCIGILLRCLREKGLEENTIIVLWGDNGMQNGSRNLWWKRTLWEASTRLPLIVKAPGFAARRVEVPVGLIDLFPTLCQLAGLPTPAGVEGVSLADVMAGASTAHPPVISSHGPRNFGVRDGHWRYILYADGSDELYDHRSDPEELENLALPATRERYANIIERLRVAVPADSAPFAPGTSDFWSDAFPGM